MLLACLTVLEYTVEFPRYHRACDDITAVTDNGICGQVFLHFNSPQF